MEYYVKGTPQEGHLICQSGWDWANEIMLSGKKTVENEFGTACCQSSAEWEKTGYRQISEEEVKEIFFDGGFFELPF